MIAPNELRRSGVTLIEVLVAIFVAAIGLLALLALFPVGALSMRQALKDSRCAQCSINATALFKSTKIGQDPALGYINLGNSNVPPDPFADAISNPALFLGTRQAAVPNGPSYPVYVDPLGASLKTLNVLSTYNHLPLPVGQDTALNLYPRILRSGVSFVTSIATYEHWFSLLDDINFDQTYLGLPCVSGGSFTRDPRYTFAYMVRRPISGNPTSFDVTVVVYVGRSINSTMGS